MGPPRVSWRPLFAREGPPARTVMVAARGGRAAPRSAARAEAASEAAVWNAPPPLSPLSMLRSPGCAASWGAGWRRRPTGTSRGRERPTRRCWACRSRWAVSRRGMCTRRPRPRRGAAGLARTWRCGTTSSTRAWLPGQPFSAAAAGGRSMGARAFPREARRWSSGCSRRSTKTPGDDGRRAIPASHSSTRRCGSCSRRATVRTACGKTPPPSSRRICALTGGLAPSGSSGC
mmetsp:Transcript_42529/g.137305  ORF Transcript_42529/g.137305 Transcript_42529/m.137305 type:complete len:232 (+) Transcript_42529:522-1217(+)